MIINIQHIDVHVLSVCLLVFDHKAQIITETQKLFIAKRAPFTRTYSSFLPIAVIVFLFKLKLALIVLLLKMMVIII